MHICWFLVLMAVCDRDIMQDSLEPGSQRHLPAFFEVIDTAKIIPMVARITIHAIDQNDPSLFRT